MNKWVRFAVHVVLTFVIVFLLLYFVVKDNTLLETLLVSAGAAVISGLVGVFLPHPNKKQ
ncbi:MAG: hypothetical protein FWC62_01765 [Firmicutes bacterium]|nr:hypothetical protein [Bacillota bacterium]